MTTMNESAENLGQKYRTLFEIIRELESLIERAVILSPDPDLRVSLSELKRSLDSSSGSDSTKTLEEAEREHILKVLQETKWVVGGPSGAAVRLGLKRTTLQARMQKLGITRRSQQPRGAEEPHSPS